jgi:hypothetical protein
MMFEPRRTQRPLGAVVSGSSVGAGVPGKLLCSPGA